MTPSLLEGMQGEDQGAGIRLSLGSQVGTEATNKILGGGVGLDMCLPHLPPLPSLSLSVPLPLLSLPHPLSPFFPLLPSPLP
jgi:hypothetical protein